MKYINFKAEMARNNVTIEDIAEFLGVHRNTIAGKVNGNQRFYADEAFKIQKRFFPNLAIEYLFAVEE